MSIAAGKPKRRDLMNVSHASIIVVTLAPFPYPPPTATIQLAYSWIFLQQTLPVSYVRFLNKHGGKDLHQYAAVKEVCARNATKQPAATLAALQGTPMARMATTLPCDFLHAGQTCGQHARGFLPQAYLRALPVYVAAVGLLLCWTVALIPSMTNVPSYIPHISLVVPSCVDMHAACPVHLAAACAADHCRVCPPTSSTATCLSTSSQRCWCTVGPCCSHPSAGTHGERSAWACFDHLPFSHSTAPLHGEVHTNNDNVPVVSLLCLCCVFVV